MHSDFDCVIINQCISNVIMINNSLYEKYFSHCVYIELIVNKVVKFLCQVFIRHTKFFLMYTL